jgi:hypothetical protein
VDFVAVFAVVFYSFAGDLARDDLEVVHPPF